MPKTVLLALLSAALVSPAAINAAAPGRWELAYFHDVDESTLTIADLVFPSASRGVAAGYLTHGNGRVEPRVLVTADGGRTWSPVRPDRPGRSLFFLNDSIGWMVATDGSLWQTLESGRSWRRLSRREDLLRVWFRDERLGWGVGANKSLWETRDGGRSWLPLAVAAEPSTTRENTVYSWIEFVGPLRGTIVGYSEPPRRDRERLPDWMVPERAERRRQWPIISIVLQTTDGGRSWTPSTTTLFGRITRTRFRPDGVGLALLRFQDSFDWPSEVYRLEGGRQTDRVFRRKDRSITDLCWGPDGMAYLAGFEPPGTLAQVPIPGRVRILRSSDLSNWEEMAVDYRAQARWTVLAPAGPGGLWAATDTGMILHLSPR
jgi:hypothetical protein